MDSAIYRIVLAPLEEDVARAKAAKVIEKHLRTWPNIIPLSHANLKSTAKKMAENLVEAPFRSFLRQNPPEILRRLPCPILALYGERDTQISPALNFGPVEEAIAASGHPLSKAMVLTGLDHLFLEAITELTIDPKNFAQHIHARTVELASNWMHRLGRYAS